MVYTAEDFNQDMAERKAQEINRKKKKLAELLDKYGESREAIDMNTDIRDTMEYMVNSGDELIDEVIDERRLKRAKSGGVSERLRNDLGMRQDEENEDNAVVANDEQGNLSAQSANYKKKDTATGDFDISENDDEKDGEIKYERSYKNTPVDSFLDDNFFNKLAFDESGHRYYAYNPHGGGIGAHGMYQLRKPILIDLGYVDSKGNWIGKNGINSAKDFYENHNEQEKAIRNMMNLYYKYLKLNKSFHFLGTKVSGNVFDKSTIQKTNKKVTFDVTISGLLAAAHREGPGFVKDYLNLLEKGKDGTYYIPENKIPEGKKDNFKHIEERLYYYAK